MLVRKKIAFVGDYQAPDTTGELVPVSITRERIARWVDQDRALRAAGITAPVAWGHQLSALPRDPALTDPTGFTSSRYNAGDVRRLEQDPADGALVAVIDAPGVAVRDGRLVSVATLANGTPVTTAIDKVSPMIGGHWTDGRGRVWEDFIAHVALTPRPVQAGQPGFQALSAAGTLRGGILMGAAMPDAKTGKYQMVNGKAVRLGADDPDKAKKKPPTAPADDTDPGDDADPAEAIADDMMVPADEDAEVDEQLDQSPGDPAGGGATDKVSRMLGNLATLGVPLPDDTDESTILDRLDVALGLLVTMKQQQATQQQDQAAQNQPRADQQPREAPMPTMMMAALPPIAREIVKREAAGRKAKRLERIEALKRRNLPVVEANRLAIAAASVTLSLDPRGHLRDESIDQTLDLLERVLPGADDPAALLSAVHPAVKEVPSPADRDGGKKRVRGKSGLMLTEEEAERARDQAKRV